MSNSISQVITHLIFSTKNRQAFLHDRSLREELHRFLGGILSRLGCQPIIIGGVEDHVHILCLLARQCDQSKMVQELKRASSIWIKTKSPALRRFAWQSGYAIFSLGHSQIGAARRYIGKQETHHRKTSFQDELRQFLGRYEVTYDERYIWD